MCFHYVFGLGDEGSEEKEEGKGGSKEEGGGWCRAEEEGKEGL